MNSLKNIIDINFTSNNNEDNKTYRRNTKQYCCNCNKKGHYNKTCREPIISLGIINIYMKDLKLNDIYFNNGKNMDMIKIEEYNMIKNYPLFNIYKNMIKNNLYFLLIQRKNSLGFGEYIRGKYEIKDEDEILKLFNQMTTKEIKMLYDGNYSFDNLWKYYWSGKDIKVEEMNMEIEIDENMKEEDKIRILNDKDMYVKNQIHLKEYIRSKKLHKEMIKNDVYNNIKERINIEYDFAEWGFPKGKREKYEKDIECAKREFMEETSIKIEDITLINKVAPIVEILEGTNKKIYKHIYFLSHSEKINVSIDNNYDVQRCEIGNIGWFLYDDIIKLVRKRHVDRLKILMDVIDFITNNYIYNNKMLMDVPIK